MNDSNLSGIVIYKIAVEMDRQRLVEAKIPKKINNRTVDERNAKFEIETNQNEKWKSERHVFSFRYLFK